MRKIVFSILLMLIMLPLAAQQYPGFRVQGRFLYDHLGEKVILSGVNKMIYWMDMDGVPSFSEIAKTGANCVRVQWLTDGTPAQLDVALYNCRSNNMIPMVELHDATGEWSKLQMLVDYWIRPDIVTVLQKHEQYLLVNIGNEVGQSVAPSEFRAGYSSAVQQMRQAGIHVPIVIDACEYGQSIDILQSEGPAIIAADPDQNLLFSVHMWWPYMWGNTDQKVIDEIAESVAMELPLIVGEFGNQWEETSEGAIPYHTIMEQCTLNEIGWLPWSWGPGNNPQDFLDMTTDSTYDTLHGWGLEVAVTHQYSIKNISKRPLSITGTTPVPTPSPTPPPEDLISIGKSATASSVETGYGPEQAVDGNLSSRWASDAAENQEITIDLGTSYNIYKVILRWEAAYGREYILQTSTDGSVWIDHHHEYNGDGGDDEILLTAAARYVKLKCLYRGTQWGFSLYEFEVYGSGDSPTPTPGGLLGDVNNSGQVDIVDALMIAQYYVGLGPQGFIESRGDVDANGSINIIDALKVAQLYVGLITEF